MRALLLPGMDGTGRLFTAFCDALPDSLQPIIASYGAFATYEEILPSIATPPPPYAIVAESFSGPLAIRLARRAPIAPQAIVLVASFVRPPRMLPRWLQPLIAKALFAIPPPERALRRWLLGPDAPDTEVAVLRETLASIPRATLAARLRAILTADASDALRACPSKLLYLAGRDDRLVPPSSIALIRSFRPDTQVAFLDAPHLVLQRNPRQAADLIAAYLSGR